MFKMSNKLVFATSCFLIGGNETCLSSQLTQCDSHLELWDSQIRSFDV